MAYIPPLIGTAVMFALCYVLAYTKLSGLQTAVAIVALLVVYSGTVVWYLKKTL
jgi:hypothetical protein